MTRNFLLVCLITIAFNSKLIAQNNFASSDQIHLHNYLRNAIGIPYYKNYTQQDYWGTDQYAQPQNWFIIQDRRNVLYFANTGGILEYDGTSWRTLTIRNVIVRSLAVDNTGKIYVGGVNEIGYLAPDSIGQLRLVSLLDSFENDQKNFSHVWKTYSTEEGVYFQSLEKLLFWSENHTNSWNPQKSFHLSFLVNGKIVHS